MKKLVLAFAVAGLAGGAAALAGSAEMSSGRARGMPASSWCRTTRPKTWA